MTVNDDEINNLDIEERNINGKPLTYKTGDVASILDETPAMIRYYCREFQEYMTLEHNPGEHRTYTEKNIEELRYILDLLKADGLSVKQVHEFLSSPEGKLSSPIFDQHDKMQELINAISSKMDDRLQEIVKAELQSNLIPTIQDMLQNSIKQLATTKDIEYSFKSIKDEVKKDNENTRNAIKEIKEDNKITREAIEQFSINKDEIRRIEENMSKMHNLVEEKFRNKDNSAKRKGIFGFFSR
ncbi:helix-turn-helix domain-containing protein [Alkaliphilus sp. B6464]|uniref:helix-turn-helix domain-containing protein n=1 Tax=Alkaliphilus sp. B6464 TaxID=2731219 RepID=UPI001BA69188|nr:MerR family transcriptional regulator [Alkaliphilus sp. B6464]QUH22084.1 MerR family transcriptional regulator [Alkaliphilus sp. B6464]